MQSIGCGPVERLPGRWLIDRDGNATDDRAFWMANREERSCPWVAWILAIKAFALGLLVEALTNALGGHGRAAGESRWGASVFLQILDPDRFGGRASFLREMSFFARLCEETPVPSGNHPFACRGKLHSCVARSNWPTVSPLHPTILPGTGFVGGEIGRVTPTVPLEVGRIYGNNLTR